MKELFECLRNCTTMALAIQTLQKKKNRSVFEREDLKFKKEVLEIYLQQLKKIIEKRKEKKED